MKFNINHFEGIEQNSVWGLDREKKWITGGDMVEGDAGAGERMLDGGSDASGVPVSRDGNGAAIIHPNEGGAYVLRDGVGIAPFRHLAVLYVPPNRRLGQRVLCLRKRHRRSASAHLTGSGTFFRCLLR